MAGKLFRRLRTLLGMRRADEEIKRELEFHLRMEAEQRERAGLSPGEARRTAMRDFGGVGRIREEVRDVRGMTFWDTLSQDVRFGLRTLRRAPGYATAAVLILALGIGANTAIFSVVNGVLLAPLPYRSGDELVLLTQGAPNVNRANIGVSIAELYEYRERLNAVRDLVEYHSMSFVLLNQGEPDRVDTGVVSANFFDMLGVQPRLGRTFVDEDDDLGAPEVLILSHEYWQSKFGGDESVVGRVLEMNNAPHTVVGVLPPHPQYPRNNDVYMPTSACPFRARAERDQMPTNPRAFAALSVFGRLAPETAVSGALAEVNVVATQFPERSPANYSVGDTLAEVQGTVQPLQDTLVEGARPMLWALAGTTMLVLLIACANVANLALARTVRRSRELAVRSALGAGRGRLLRQLVTESLIVALVGGLLGLVLAAVSMEMLTTFVGRFTPRTGQIAISGPVLLFTLAASIVTGIVFGAVPALTARRNLAGSMRDGGVQAGETAGRHRIRSGLVIAQVAVSFVLLVGAALLLQSFYRLASVPLGYRTEQVMTAAIFGNFSQTDGLRIQNDILERLRTSPGVRSAAMTNAVPQLTVNPFPQVVLMEGIEAAGSRPLEAVRNVASDQYFETLDISLLSGRDFRPADDPNAESVAVINQTMAGFWDGRSPLGRRFRLQGGPTTPEGEPIWTTVVGVASDFRLYGADQDIAAQFYMPMNQVGGGGGRILVRTELPSGQAVALIKDAVFAADSQTPIEEIQTLDQVRNGRLAVPGLTTALLGIFAGVALLITLAGIAGVIGTSVSQRTREFGLRMALGASRVSVLRRVLQQGVVLVAIGVALGVAGAAAFSQLISSFLFATQPTEVSAYVLVALVFLFAALLAAFGPARRATTIDPLTALRSE